MKRVEQEVLFVERKRVGRCGTASYNSPDSLRNNAAKAPPNIFIGSFQGPEDDIGRAGIPTERRQMPSL